MGKRALGSFVALILSYWVGLWSTGHAYFSTSFLHLLVLFSRSQNKGICPRKVLPYLHMVHFSSHILFLLTDCSYQPSLVGSTAIQLSVFETYTLAPCLLGFYRPRNLSPWLLKTQISESHSIKSIWHSKFWVSGFPYVIREAEMEAELHSLSHLVKKKKTRFPYPALFLPYKSKF